MRKSKQLPRSFDEKQTVRQCHDMTSFLTPQQAADRAKCARSTIMKVLASGELRATRNNSGRWKIDPVALDDWLSLRDTVRQSPAVSSDSQNDSLRTVVETLRGERDEARLEAAALRAEGAQLRERLDELRSDRDQLRADRDNWQRLAERSSQPRPGLLDRLFGYVRSRNAHVGSA